MDRRLPGSVALAIRGAWGLVVLIGLTVVLMALFYNSVIGSWARRHDGAREAFAQGGRLFAFGNGGSATDAMDVVADFRGSPAGVPPGRRHHAGRRGDPGVGPDGVLP